MKNKNKYIFSCLLVIFTNILPAQSNDFDQDYLNSLPDSIRQDVENELLKNKESKESKQVYLNPSSKLNKSQTILQWEKFKKENDLRQDESERYGMRLFNSMQSSFMPVNEPNFDSSYILDFGDVLGVDIYDAGFDKYKLDIKRDGSIVIPGVGKIYLAGLELSEAIDLVSSRIRKILVLDSVVSLESVRDIQILMTGEIYFPGIYTFNGNTNPLHAVSMAGGIKESGSFRKVLIKRNGEVINQIDLYDALIFGNTSFNTQLQSGDTILITPVQKLIRAGAGFLNRGLFELVKEETLEDLISFTGGFSSKFNVKKNELTLDRMSDGGSFITSSINLNNYTNFELNNYDFLRGQEFVIRKIKIEGEVKNPGIYSIQEGETISSAIIRAGGYTQNAFPFGGVLLSDKARKKEQKNLDKAYHELISYLVSSSTSSVGQSATSLPLLLAEVKNTKAVGRVVAEFDTIRLASGKAADTLLGDNDVLNIPAFDNKVYVFGEVSEPGGIFYDDEYSAYDYLNSSGGLSKYADKKYIYIVDPNGIAKKMNVKNLSFLNNNNHSIYPGSIIYVPRNVEFRDEVEFLSLISPVFSSLAVSIASLSAISND
mgnify:CR=1 FL=1